MREERFARFRATPAGLGANAAVLHLRAVSFADAAAAFASLDAGAELRAREFKIGPGEAGNDPGGGKTDIGAIVAVANALHHVADVLFAETCVGAGVARFGAGIAGGDALDRGGMIG